MAVVITRQMLRQLGGEPSTAVAVARAVAQGDRSTRIMLKAGDQDSVLAWLMRLAGAVDDGPMLPAGGMGTVTAALAAAARAAGVEIRTGCRVAGLGTIAAEEDLRCRPRRSSSGVC